VFVRSESFAPVVATQKSTAAAGRFFRTLTSIELAL